MKSGILARSRFLLAALSILVAHPASAFAREGGWGRYMENKNCEIIGAEHPLAKEFPEIVPYINAGKDAGKGGGVEVKACTYDFWELPKSKKIARKGWVILADPSDTVLDRWITKACTEGAPRRDDCVEKLGDYINGQSGGQFPVVGYVAEGGEKAQECKQNGQVVNRQGLIAFRHGVTVQLYASVDDKRGEAIYCSTDGWSPDEQRKRLRELPIAEVFKFARLSGLPCSCAKEALAQQLVCSPSTKNNAFLSFARDNHLAAIEKGVDALMVEQARRFAKGIGFGSDCAPQK